MRRGVCPGLAALAAAALGACSSSTPLAQVTSDGTATSTTATTTTTSTASASATTSATPGGLSGLATTTVDTYPSVVAGDAKDAADAYVAYWTFVTTSGADPVGVDVAAGVGKVATGSAANHVISQVGDWKQRGVHLIGPLRLTIKTATTSEAQGTVCAGLTDLTTTADAGGKATKAQVPQSSSQKGTLEKDGPTWRVSAMDQVSSC